MTRYTYLDLVGPDGALNVAAFNQILDSRVIAEINSQLCGSAGLWAPASIGLGGVREWNAEQVKARKLGPLNNEEVARITGDERAALEGWCGAMAAAAKRQKRAMDDAYLEAAE